MSDDYIKDTQNLWIKSMYGEHATEGLAGIVLQHSNPQRNFHAGIITLRDVKLPNLQAVNVPTLVILDIIARPRLIVENKRYSGAELAGLYTSSIQPLEWMNEGNILFKNL